MPDLKTLIGYIVDQVNDRDGVVGKTALVKLVYLIDVEHYRRFAKPVTNLKWIFHHYGPYTVELEPVINDNEFVAGYGGRSSPGYRYYGRRDWREIHVNFNAQFSASARQVADKVINEWGLESLPTILDYVYFETEPMQEARRGEFLDFSKIQKEPAVPRRNDTFKLPTDTINTLRIRLKERSEKAARKMREPTEPVYDQVYDEASRMMEEEEGRIANIRPNTKLSGPEREWSA